MITLDQVQKLEKKVNDAVDLINRFKAEKVVLEEKVENYELRIMELEDIAEQLNKDQNEIEDKIIGALNQLEDLESIEDTFEIEEEENADPEAEALQEVEISAESSVSEEEDIVETETDEEESDNSVENSENTEEAITNYDDDSAPQVEVDEEIVENVDESDANLNESEDDDQSELQESITENPQDGLTIEETVKEEEIPTVDSEFGEMLEDKPAEKNNSGSDLFEQSLDIF